MGNEGGLGVELMTHIVERPIPVLLMGIVVGGSRRSELFGGACGDLVGFSLSDGWRVPGPRLGEERGTPIGRCGDTGGVGNDGGSRLVSSSDDPGSGGGSPRGGRGPGSSLGGWGVSETIARMFVVALVGANFLVGLVGIFWLFLNLMVGGSLILDMGKRGGLPLVGVLILELEVLAMAAVLFLLVVTLVRVGVRLVVGGALALPWEAGRVSETTARMLVVAVGMLVGILIGTLVALLLFTVLKVLVLVLACPS